MVNIVATRFRTTQRKLKDKKTFGAIYSGPNSPFFYRSWKYSYRAFNKASVAAFSRGQAYYSEFDLVSFYEIIDHNVLRGILGRKGLSEEFLDFLFGCISKWTTSSTSELHHGIPQGPLPSAFLAECLLFEFDELPIPGVTYLRYVDDIRLLSRRPQPIIRALISLDIASKQYGLVPQAQKITKPKKASTSAEIIKSIPSLSANPSYPISFSQRGLWKIFRASIKFKDRRWTVVDATKFRFCLNRMAGSKRVLAIVSQLALNCSDVADTISAFLIGCGKNVQARNIASDVLAADPVFDAVAALYIDAIQACSPGKLRIRDIHLVERTKSLSVEKSILIELASSRFTAVSGGKKVAAALVKAASCPLVKSLLIEQLFVTGPFPISSCRSILVDGCIDESAEYSRYCAALILTSLLGTKMPSPTKRNKAVSLLLHDLGVTRQRPRPSTVLEVFFNEKLGITSKINWSKIFGRHRKNAEEKCLRMQKLSGGDPSARITMVDSFNDLLTQFFCRAHPILSPPYRRATRPNWDHPDIGAWLNQTDMAQVVPISSAWFKQVHDARLAVDLAHAVKQSGPHRGQFTKPISHRDASVLMAGQRRAYAELFNEWRRVI